jgi:hypothetical protein
MRLLVSNGEDFEGEVKELKELGRYLKHGKGRLSHKGSVYDGDWLMDMRDGHGVQTYANGTRTVANSTRAAVNSTQMREHVIVALRVDWRTHRWLPGDVYEGEMKKNVRHGAGTLRLKSGEMYVHALWHNTCVATQHDTLQHGRHAVTSAPGPTT